MDRLIAGEQPNYTQADIDKISVSAADLVRRANNALRLANDSQAVAFRREKSLLAKSILNQLHILCQNYPFLHLTSLTEFEDSIKSVDLQTSQIIDEKNNLGDNQGTVSRKIVPRIPVRVSKIAELIDGKIKFLNKNIEKDYSKNIFSAMEMTFDGPQWEIIIHIGERASEKAISIEITPFISHSDYSLSLSNPYIIDVFEEISLILFRDRFFSSSRILSQLNDREEACLRVKKNVYDEEGDLNSIRSAVSNLEAAVEFQRTGPKREPIPDDVKLLVWSRDGASCIRCGSQERLHFDHIIPVAKGGSNDAVNIQLLCQTCNLKKSDKIAF